MMRRSRFGVLSYPAVLAASPFDRVSMMSFPELEICPITGNARWPMPEGSTLTSH